MIPRVVIMSLWRDDLNRRISERVEHLLAKSYPKKRYVWVVGDSSDDTEGYLRNVANTSKEKIVVVRHDTNEPKRLPRLSMTANAGFDEVLKGDHYWLMHESDIESPVEIVEQLLATGKCPVAGWPMLGDMFYDTWGYRHDGVRFFNNPPYSACYKPDELFEVDSFGTVGLFPAADVRAGMRMQDDAFRDLCKWQRERGNKLWVDPRIIVRQPTDLWIPYGHES